MMFGSVAGSSWIVQPPAQAGEQLSGVIRRSAPGDQGVGAGCCHWPQSHQQELRLLGLIQEVSPLLQGNQGQLWAVVPASGSTLHCVMCAPGI